MKGHIRDWILPVVMVILVLNGCLMSAPFPNADNILGMNKKERVTAITRLPVSEQLKLWRYAFYGTHPPRTGVAQDLVDAGVITPQDVIDALGSCNDNSDARILIRL